MRKRGFEKIAAYADRSFPMPTRQNIPLAMTFIYRNL